MGQKSITVLNTHTAYSGAKAPDQCHIQQLSEIAKYATEKVSPPAILGGDFNSGLDLSYKNSSYFPWEKIWEPFLGHLGVTWRYESVFNYVRQNLKKLPTLAWDWDELPLRDWEKSWDEENNPLVFYPVVPWEEQTSTLDHIFLSPGWQEYHGFFWSQLMFNLPVEVSGCKDHQVKNGMSFLSDHFGVETTLTLK